MNYQPIAIVLFAYVIGILGFTLFPFFTPFYLIIFTSLLFVLGLFLILNKKIVIKFYQYSVIILFFFLGILLTYFFEKKPKNHFSNYLTTQSNIIVFEIDEVTNISYYYKKYFVKLTQISHHNSLINTQGKILLKIPSKKEMKLLYGKKYVAIGKIIQIPRNKNLLSFDYKKYLARKLIYYEIKPDTLFAKKANNAFSLHSIKNIKNILLNNLEKSNYSLNSKEILRALTFGDRSDMRFESFRNFSKAGIIHILAISGMHILFIFQFLLFMFNQFSFYSPKKITITLVLLFIWMYGFILGFPASVFRAILMISIYYIFYFLNRKPNIFHTLSLSALIILLLNPQQLFNVGFQLSYTAVFFIVWLTKPISNLFNARKEWAKKGITFFSVTLAAQLGTLPISLYYFHQYSLLSLFANFIIIPFLGILIGFSFICVFQLFIFPDFTWVADVYNYYILGLYKFRDLCTKKG